MKHAEFMALARFQKVKGAIGYGPHRRQVTLYRSSCFEYVFVFGYGLYHYRSIQLHPCVSADLLKESNNKK